MRQRRKESILLPKGYDPRLLLWCFFIMSSLPSCCVCKHCKYPVGVQDSIAVHHRDSVDIRDSVAIRDSIIPVPLPLESALALLPQMMPSHLETSLAESDAFVDSLGLHHFLKNKDGYLDAHVPVLDHYHSETHIHQQDSTATHSQDITVEVEKNLTWWQKFRLDAFWWLVGGVALLLLWTFRKSILKIV